jgi:hypothetical protein
MYEIILSVILALVAIYAIYLQKELHDERIRREWDLAYFYYQSHPQDFEMLTKEYFFQDHPILKKVFADSKIEEIKDCLKKGNSNKLPFLPK